MIAGEGTELIRRPARDVYEFILDFERYRKADHKIAAVHSFAWLGEGRGEVCYSGRFRGLRTPAVRQTVTVEPHRRIDVRSIPGTLAHLTSRFHGTFTFEELDRGVTRVFHREEIEFPIPLAWIMEPYLGRWLAADTPEEMRRLKAMLER
jgi:hypothetical protein